MVERALLAAHRPFSRPEGAAEAVRSRTRVPPFPAGPASCGHLREAPISLLLAHSPRAGNDLAADVPGAVLDLAAADRNELIDTLELWFECGGSNIEVARRMHFRRNTIHQRLRRIETLTGRRCSDPKSAAELFVALRAVRLGVEQ